jgi:hydrogenase nickel incorporation protein HypB
MQEIRVYREIHGVNEEWAEKNRLLLAEHNVVMLNIIGSPGSGKTSLLEAASDRLSQSLKFAVLEGDVETTRDAERLHALNVPVSQLITGNACHLNAKLVHAGLSDLDLENLDLVIVENVGNLLCPSQFDIGETAKIAVLSVTEGEDKPIKYPLLFREASAVVLTKTDLLAYLPFNLDSCLGYIRQVNNEIPIFQVSATTGAGVDEWLDWVVKMRKR